MTVGTLSSIVVYWSLGAVAADAIVETGMVKPNFIPFVGAVASGALTRIVVHRSLGSVAVNAVVKVGVIERCIFPVDIVVAGGAFPIIMIIRSVTCQVAGLAIGETGVIKGNVSPVGGVDVAIHTCAGK